MEKVYDHLLKIYDLLFESERSSEIFMFHTKTESVRKIYDRNDRMVEKSKDLFLSRSYSLSYTFSFTIVYFLQ